MDQRHLSGPRSLGQILPRITRPAFRRYSPASAQILADWPEIVGPALAAVTTPRRLVSGTLTLACSGPIAIELQHMATEVIERINRHLGSQAVHRLRFVQMVQVAKPAAQPHHPSAAPAEAADAAVAYLPAGALRDALAALGRVVLDRVSTAAPSKR